VGCIYEKPKSRHFRHRKVLQDQDAFNAVPLLGTATTIRSSSSGCCSNRMGKQCHDFPSTEARTKKIYHRTKSSTKCLQNTRDIRRRS
jgi:hypothetical protein